MYRVGVAIVVLQISAESECPELGLEPLNLPRLLCHLWLVFSGLLSGDIFYVFRRLYGQP